MSRRPDAWIHGFWIRDSGEPRYAFPRRVIFLAAFDTGIDPQVREKYWPGEFDVVRRDAPAGAHWGVSAAVPRKDSGGKWIRLQIKPTRPVGECTKLRFRYHLTGATKMTVQIFDLTDGDNRHVHLSDLKQDAWTTQYLDFTRDGRRNDGRQTPFSAGHAVDDIFFFTKPDGDEEVKLYVDEVVLFDAGETV